MDFFKDIPMLDCYCVFFASMKVRGTKSARRGKVHGTKGLTIKFHNKSFKWIF